jgi:hypothetical protein
MALTNSTPISALTSTSLEVPRMTIVDSENALRDALAYARASQQPDGGVLIEPAGDLVIVTHSTGHRRAFRQESSQTRLERRMERLLTNLAVDNDDSWRGGSQWR